MSSQRRNGLCPWSITYMQAVRHIKLLTPRANSWRKGECPFRTTSHGLSSMFISYKESGEAMRRKQDKEREAAGLPPVQRLGARAAAPQRGQRGGVAPARGAPGRGRATGIMRGGSSGTPRTFHQPDKNLYVHLLGLLRKKALLPVVVFTFSKKRCEENAGTLTNMDLSTSVEKSEVHITIEKALSRLKGIARADGDNKAIRSRLS